MDYYGLINIPESEPPTSYLNTLCRLAGVPCFNSSIGASSILVYDSLKPGELSLPSSYNILYKSGLMVMIDSDIYLSTLIIILNSKLNRGDFGVPIPDNLLYTYNSWLYLVNIDRLQTLLMILGLKTLEEGDFVVIAPPTFLSVYNYVLSRSYSYRCYSLLEILPMLDLQWEELAPLVYPNSIKVEDGSLQIDSEPFLRVKTVIWREPYFSFKNIPQVLIEALYIKSSVGYSLKFSEICKFLLHLYNPKCVFVSGHLGTSITQAIDLLDSFTEIVYTYTHTTQWPGILAPSVVGTKHKLFIYGGVLAIPPHSYVNNIFSINFFARCLLPIGRIIPYWEEGPSGDVDRQGAVGLSHIYHGYFVGGVATLPVSAIERLTFSTVTISLLQKRLATPRGFSAEVCSNTKGYILGGYSRIYPQRDAESFDFNTYSISTFSKFLPVPISHATGTDSLTTGYIAGGFSNVTTPLNLIMKMPFSTESISILSQTLVVGRHSLCGCQAPFKGYFGGGFPTEYTTEIDAIIFSTETYQDVNSALSQAKGYIGAGQTWSWH